jgi:hypothetical protein
MLFDKPVPFEKAIQYRKAQKVLPLSVGSAEISRIAPELRERALFSAHTSSLTYLGKMDALLAEMTSPTARAERGESAMDAASVRIALRNQLAAEGYLPPENKAGGLQDLSSDTRLNLIIDTQLKQTYGWAQNEIQNDPDTIDAFPCLELVRVSHREVPRVWRDRWVRAGGKLYAGRMIARKDSPIWSAISRFGLPYPPFDFNSGMGTRDVDRPTAESLGAIKRSESVTAKQRPLNEAVKSSLPALSAPLLAAVMQSLGDLFSITPTESGLEAALEDLTQ